MRRGIKEDFKTMTMTVTFNSFDEMVDFAKNLAGQGHESVKQPTFVQEPAQPAAPMVPTTPVTSAPAAPAAPAPFPTAPAAPAAIPTTPVPPAPAATVPTAVPTSTHTYTPDDLAKAAMLLMDSGKQQELIALLGQFGAAAIPELRPEQYGAFATALRGMGAQI